MNLKFTVFLLLPLILCSCVSKQQYIPLSQQTFSGRRISAEHGSYIEKASIKPTKAVQGDIAGEAILNNLPIENLLYARQAQEKAHMTPIGEIVSWSNRSTSDTGTITPIREGKTHTGILCREYIIQIKHANKTEKIKDTLCQQSDGSWRLSR